jgi:adenylate cyclase
MVSLLLHAVLAQAEGDDVAYRDFAERFRTVATSHEAQGFIALADAMT